MEHHRGGIHYSKRHLHSYYNLEERVEGKETEGLKGFICSSTSKIEEKIDMGSESKKLMILAFVIAISFSVMMDGALAARHLMQVSGIDFLGNINRMICMLEGNLRCPSPPPPPGGSSSTAP
ncbi:hypothetical protein V8G54_000923 [Vigna mungo]|uniref:Uncharacterized protein n=1 Tax=Vigna mungo TaxID=3915 RepID=A0AAQ3P6M4_VIGMU